MSRELSKHRKTVKGYIQKTQELQLDSSALSRISDGELNTLFAPNNEVIYESQRQPLYNPLKHY